MVHFAETNQVSSPYSMIAAYWQSSNTEACVKKLSQILANNIDNRGSGNCLRINVRYCLKKINEEKGVWKKRAFF